MTRVDPAQIDAAVAVLDALAARDAQLGPLTTYGLGGPAAVLVEARTVADLHLVAQARRASDLPVLMVGRGSNLLVADSGFAGIAVRLAGDFEQIRALTEGAPGRIWAGAAVAMPVLARRSAAMGLRGMEWAVGVPGSVGGAVRMNAGGHGSDMARNLVRVEVMDLLTGQITDRESRDLGLRFRGSDLGDHEVVLAAVVALDPGVAAEAEAVIAEVVRWRREHQPGGRNCGSVFVNPIPGELSAGELIDGCGLRGMRRGGAVVSPKHANFIQAEEGATAADVWELIGVVRAAVERETGIHLRSEVRIVGFEER